MVYDNLCRFCGHTTLKSDSLLHDSNKDLLIDIVKYLPVKINTTDLLPKIICSDCTYKAKDCTKFIKEILDSEKRFNERIANVTNNKELIIKRASTNTLLLDVKQESDTFVSDPLGENISNSNLKSSKAAVQKALDKIQNASKGLIIKKISTKIESSPSISLKFGVRDIESMKYKTENESELIEMVTCGPRFETDVVIPEPSISDDDNDPDYEDVQIISDDEHEEDDNDDDYKPVKRQEKPKNKNNKSDVIVLKMDLPAAYVCMTCKSKFPGFDELKHHMKSNFDCKSVYLTCKECNKVCPNRKSLYQHTLTHRDKITHMCDECGKGYTNKFNLENHKSSFHGEYFEECGVIYKCKICDAQFSQRRELYEHIKVHSNEKKVHLCETCGKSFKTADALRSHNRGHLDIRPYHCTVTGCDKKYRNRIHLIQHAHVHTGVKAFNCEVCAKSFAKRGSLTLHKRTHTGETPYSCTKCPERFATPNKLKTHLRMHITNP